MNGLLYMLDTNILSDTIRNPFGTASQYMERVSEDAMCVSAIVASEMRYGIRKRGSPRLSHLVENTLSRIAIVPYDDAASQSYGVIRDTLERQGKSIGWADLFIAAHAYSLGLTIVTNNVREFSRVEGLKIENWLATEERP
ncbi:type II toxin-antitoxin system VapC family toxin [Pararhizobium sp. YC-54]|uniref:type II toxin-antitoxin system VapC family toxin n=1 Tax=Pararhizobium sp. YC-54 TaxID=2986920 RepID=UPI0021F7D19E|nr:type II toxin-antitoxin system VapC family toxin [Pararhizobium sp. YC-54]MCV9997616.1 type II toxin-antitoxin system VapC family toxin [Pararhizobium sp. YC-54]